MEFAGLFQMIACILDAVPADIEALPLLRKNVAHLAGKK